MGNLSQTRSAIFTKCFHFANKLASFLITTSIFLAISGSFKILFSNLLFNTFALDTLVLTFLITFSIYGLNKLTDLNEDSINTPQRANTIKKLEPYFKFSVIVSLILSLILGFLVNIMMLPVLLFPIFSGIIYSVRLPGNLPRLKDITGIKNISIALSWAVVSTFLPAIYLFDKKMTLILLIFYLFFIKSYINSILFDVRDIEGDRKTGIKTIPILLGVKKTKTLLIFLNSTLLIWLLFSYSQGFFYRYILVLILAIFYGYCYILIFCREGKKTGISLDLMVDGEFMAIAVIALIFAGRIQF